MTTKTAYTAWGTPKFVYTARLVPLDQPITISDQDNRPLTVTYRADTMALQAKRPKDVAVLLQHDRSLQIGQMTSLLVHRGWWLGTFILDRFEGIEFEVGDPVSVGAYVFERGSGEPIVREISVVTRARVEGAQIIMKDRLPDLPVARVPSDQPAASGEIFHGGQKIRRYFTPPEIVIR